jgi:hypothetical protein
MVITVPDCSRQLLIVCRDQVNIAAPRRGIGPHARLPIIPWRRAPVGFFGAMAQQVLPPCSSSPA